MHEKSKLGVRVCAASTVLLVSLAALSHAAESASKVRAATEEATLIVVRSSAQWCKVCSSATSAYAERTKQLSTKPVLFVTLDRTDDASTRQAIYLAKALGIDEQLADNMKRVGTLTILDAKSKQRLSTLSLAPDVETMSEFITTALDSPS